MNQGRLAGRAAVVTGAADGVGRGIVRRFAEEGAAVLVADLDEVAGGAVAEELRAAGAQASFFRCDVTEKDNVEAMIATCADRYGAIDILVNNAYRGNELARVEKIEVLKEKDEMMERLERLIGK